MAKRLSREKERYLAARQELNPRSTQAESSHEPLSRDMVVLHSVAVQNSIVLDWSYVSILFPNEEKGSGVRGF